MRCDPVELDRQEVWAPFRYGGPVRDAVVRLKGSGGVGAERFLREAVTVWSRHAQTDAIEAVISVPPHARRLRERLGHLPDAFARELACHLPRARVVLALRRTDDEPVRDHRTARYPVFEADEPGRGRTALVVDDVVTTGTTWVTAAQAAEDAGWRVAAGLCLADARANRGDGEAT